MVRLSGSSAVSRACDHLQRVNADSRDQVKTVALESDPLFSPLKFQTKIEMHSRCLLIDGRVPKRGGCAIVCGPIFYSFRPAVHSDQR